MLILYLVTKIFIFRYNNGFMIMFKTMRSFLLKKLLNSFKSNDMMSGIYFKIIKN